MESCNLFFLLPIILKMALTIKMAKTKKKPSALLQAQQLQLQCIEEAKGGEGRPFQKDINLN